MRRTLAISSASRAVIDERMTSPLLPITAGPHEVGFTWVERPAVEQSVWQPPLRATQEAHNPSGLPRLDSASIEGPYDATGVSPTPSRQRILLSPAAVAGRRAGVR